MTDTQWLSDNGCTVHAHLSARSSWASVQSISRHTCVTKTTLSRTN